MEIGGEAESDDIQQVKPNRETLPPRPPQTKLNPKPYENEVDDVQEVKLNR